MPTIKGVLEAASMMPVSITTGSETRPTTTARVLWIGSTTRPTNMAEGDVWFALKTGAATSPEFVTNVLNTLTQGAPFSQALVLNGTTPMTFAVTTGTLPAGLSLHSTTGVISGTPSGTGTYTFSVQATNSLGSATQTFNGTVTSSAVAPDITTTALTSLTQGTAFSQTLNATGTSPMTWTVASGTLPAGLSLNSGNGTITGTPTGSGAYSVTIQVTNVAGSDSQAYSGTISATGIAPTITTASLNPLQAGISFTQTLSRLGSTPLTWGVSGGTIPAGLSINSSTGTISGTPTTAGAYSFTVTATNSFGSDPQLFTGTVGSSAPADVYSIFEATPPASPTSYSDGVVGGWQVHQYYQSTGETALPSASRIIGARIYIPAGSAHIGQSWKAAVYLNNTGNYIYSGNTIDTVAALNGSGTSKLGSSLVEGWNEILFNAEHVIPVGAGNSWLIGTMIADGSRYLYDTSTSALAIKSAANKNFYLSEVGGATVTRGLYLSTTSTVRWYGIDVLLRIPA